MSLLKVIICGYVFIAKCASREADYTKGIFQSIGFKEFHDYLTSPAEPSAGREEALARGVQALKVTTRRYARKQIKWIKRRFLQITDRQVFCFYYYFALTFFLYVVVSVIFIYKEIDDSHLQTVKRCLRFMGWTRQTQVCGTGKSAIWPSAS